MSDALDLAVLMGGGTREHEVSLATGTAVADALDRAGHRVRRVVLESPAVGAILDGVRAVDAVFIALHGGAGEDGRVQSVLELAGVPYVGSGPGPSAVAMDKIWTKAVARDLGLPVTDEVVLRPDDDAERVRRAAVDLGGHVVLKPVAEGSAVGVHLCDDPDAVVAAWEATDRGHGAWMLEPYVPGREITVPLLWGEAYAVIEIRPHAGFYDYSNKYTAGNTEYDCPADLPAADAEALAAHALRLYGALHLRDMARIDFRLDPDRGPFLLEVNTIPGMTGTSLLPMGAAHAGIDFDALCDRLCRGAVARGATT